MTANAHEQLTVTEIFYASINSEFYIIAYRSVHITSPSYSPKLAYSRLTPFSSFHFSTFVPFHIHLIILTRPILRRRMDLTPINPFYGQAAAE
jgi:hypothetical protein